MYYSILKVSFILALVFMIYQGSAQVKTIVQSGHFAPVKEITVHPNKRTAATTDGYKIKLWDLETGLESGELTVGYDRKLPISQLKFVNDSIDIILSFVMNNRIIFKEVKSNKLVKIEDLPLDEKINGNEYDLLKLKYSDRNESEKSMRRYESAVEKLNEKYEEEWTEYFSETINDGNYLSTKEHSIFYIRYKNVAGSKRDFNKRFRSFKRRIKSYGKSYSPDSLGWEHGIFNLHRMKWKRDDMKVCFYNESFKGKKKLISEVPIDYVLTSSRLKSIWMSPSENFSVLGNSLLYTADTDRKMEKKTRRLIALLSNSYNWTSFSINPNESIFVRARSTDNESIVEMYDLSKVIRTYDKKGQVKRDTALYLPLLRTITLSKVKALTLTNELLLVLYDDERLEAINLNDGVSLPSLFYPENQGLELFEKVNAFYFEPSSNTVYITGTTSRFQQICFRAFSLDSKTYSWSFGSEFPLAVLKVEDFSKERLITGVYRKGNNLKSLSLNQLSKDNSSLLGYASINFKDLSNDVIIHDESWLYSPDKTMYFVKDTANYLWWNNFLTNDNKRLIKVSKDYCIKWDPTSKEALGFENKEIHYVNGLNGSLEDSLTWNNKILDACFDAASRTIFFLDSSYQLIQWSYSTPTRKASSYSVLKGIKEPKNFDKRLEKFGDGMGIISKKAEKLEDRLGKMKVISSIPLSLGNPKKLSKKNIVSTVDELSRAKEVLESPGNNTSNKRSSEQQIRKRLSEEEKEKYFLRQVPNRIETSADGKFLLFLPYNGFEMRIYDLTTDKKSPVQSIAPISFRFEQSFLRYLEGKSIEGGEIDFSVVNNIRNSRIERTIVNFIEVDSAWNNLVYARKVKERKAKYYVWNCRSGKKIKIKQKSSGRLKPYLSESGRFLALSSSDDLVNTIKVYDLNRKGRMVKKIVGHGGEVYFSSDEQFLLSSGTDNQFKVWDLSTVQSVIDVPMFSYIVSLGADNGIIYDDKGFYTTENASIRTIAFSYDGNSYPLEQFDLLKNRPDNILKLFNRISGLDSASTSHSLLRDLANYRTSIIGGKNSDQERLSDNLPEIRISGYLDYNGSAETVSVDYSLNSEINDPITRLEVYNNNIPWKTILIDNQTEVNGNLAVSLMFGENNLKFVATSYKGYKSISKYVLIRRIVDSVTLSSRKVHLILVGVDSYPQGLDRLSKPLEDCSRIERLFKEYSPLNEKENVIVHKIYNNEASKAALLDTIRSLAMSSINDEFVMLLSGHGILMDEFNFVLPLDPTVADRSLEYLSYSELIGELQKLPMAKKLLMIDACHSGLGLNNPEFAAKDIELYYKMFFNYSLPTGVQVLSSSYGLEKASDGYFGVVFENVLNSFDGKVDLMELFRRIKEYNELDKQAIQKISLTNINPLLDWQILRRN